MRARALPAHEVRTAKLDGAPYVTHSLYVGGICIASRLGPFGEGEVEQLVRMHVQPVAREPAGPYRYGRNNYPTENA